LLKIAYINVSDKPAASNFTPRHWLLQCATIQTNTLIAQPGQQLNYHGWRNDYRQNACVYSIIASATDEFFHAQLYAPRCTAGFDVTFRQTCLDVQ